MIAEGHKANFETLLRAARGDDLALMEVRERATGETRVALVAVNQIGEEGDAEEFEFVPLALMVDGDPCEMYDPPDPAGGFREQVPA